MDPIDFYSEEFCLSKYGPGFENLKVKVRIAEAYPSNRAGEMRFDLKVLAITDTIKMVPIIDVMRHLSSKTPKSFVEVYKELIGPLPEPAMYSPPTS